MDSFLFLVAFCTLAVFYLAIGLYASKDVSNTTDYFLAGRSLGIPSVMFTLIATQLGGGLLLGTAQEAYNVGLYGIMYTLGMGIGFLILGFGLASRLQSLGVNTTAELFETKYGSTTLKKIASLLSIITLSGILIAQIVGSKSFLLSIGFDNQIVFLCFWSFTIFYTMMGGLKAVILTDIAQVALIIFIFSSLFLYSIFTNPTSLPQVLNSNFSTDPNVFNTRTLISTLIMPILFSLIEQDLAQRFFASRSAFVARISALGAGILLLLFSFIPIYFGMYARISSISIPFGANPLMPIIGFIGGGTMFILSACAIIAAINSTADSLLCAIASNLAQDFSLLRSIRSSLKRSQLITLLIGILAIIASYCVPGTIISILIHSYELSVYTLFIPLIACYFLPRVRYNAALYSVITSSLLLVLFFFWQPPIHEALLIFSCSAAAYWYGNKNN